MKTLQVGFSSIFMESFELLVPNADLCWDISSDRAFWLGGNKNEMRALVKG